MSCAAFGAALLVAGGCQSGPGAAAPNTLTVSLSEGELFSVIAVKQRSGPSAAQARKAYFQNAFGVASAYGLRPFGSLNVTQVIAGDFDPEVVAFYAWPSAAAEASFDRDPTWTPIKATRPNGWSGLRVHDDVAHTNVELAFSSDKFYTLASAWIDPERPADYDTYLQNIVPAVQAVGGRFMYQMVDPNFSALDADTRAPGRLTLVEWDSPAGLDAFLKSQGYRQNAALVRSGTTRFEVVALSVPDPS